MSKYCAKYGYELKTLSPGLSRRLLSYRWPGNVRELENVIHRGVVMSQGRALMEEDAPLLRGAGEVESGESVEYWARRLAQKRLAEGRLGGLLDEAVAAVEIPLFRFLLEELEGNKTRAAEALGINRNTLHTKLKRYGLLDYEEGAADDAV